MKPPPTEPATPHSLAPPAAAEVALLATASNQLGFDLWTQVRATQGNLALSPASISLALTMTWGGARNATATQMQQTLHLPDEVDRVSAWWGALAAALQRPDREGELRIANRLFGERSYALEAAFLERTRQAFGTPLEPVDFGTQPDAARVHINQWVAAQTNQRIKDLLPPPAITATTRLVLVNAIYFLAAWLQPFEKARTRDVPFFPTKATSVPVPTMHALAWVRYAQVSGASVLELPYRGNDTAMMIVLPDAIDGLAAVERTLSSDQLATWTTALAPGLVQIALPRFEIDPAAPLALSAPLQALGMKDAFVPGRADFSGISRPARAEDELFISDVFHKAFVKTDEQGTEAAAATAIAAAAQFGPPPAAFAFKADHPFLFFIINRASGLVLFMGRVAAPA